MHEVYAAWTSIDRRGLSTHAAVYVDTKAGTGWLTGIQHLLGSQQLSLSTRD